MDNTIVVIDHRRKDLEKKVRIANDNNDNNPVHSPMDKYLTLPTPKDKCVATYVWIDGTGEYLRSKETTLKLIPIKPKDKFEHIMDKIEEKIRQETFESMSYSQQNKYLPPYYCPRNLENTYKIECKLRKTRNRDSFDENLKDLPILSFDGKASGLTKRNSSDMYLIPRAIYGDPFKRGNNILVMCDTYTHRMEPTRTNHRYQCAATYNKCREHEPWFGVEQEFYLLNPTDSRPAGWPKCGFPRLSHQSYCGLGANKVVGRELVEAHYRCCLHAGIPMWGTNPELVPSQWEYQVGPSVGIDAGDDVWMSRYILNILGEKFGVVISFDPKPVANWVSSGAHINFSTLATRGVNGISAIQRGIKRLAAFHERHIQVYDPRGGLDNKKRLTADTGLTSAIDKFTAGIADRLVSVRIPRMVAEDKCGFLEDRRPASNSDPYRVINALMSTVILNE
ncbi:glutamine synthetase [Spodoptera frugiperda]|uniref:glutamine synthetase n=1 Tax=Spodoptera frugiperda TaxID=7108 RepID=A0A9R0CXI7_SPOFR|nr:glutamine synthetase [Spodoptera frugiperda]